jgi:hypothetical protein
MKDDKDTIALIEAYSDYFLRSNKPITRKVQISADVRITKTTKGWDVQVFDPEVRTYIPASEFLSDAVLRQYSKDQKNYERNVSQSKAGMPQGN